MSSVCKALGAASLALLARPARARAEPRSRRCASAPIRTTCRSRTERGEGFENRIADARRPRPAAAARRTSGCRSAAASSATRSMPDAATSSSACRRGTACCSRREPTTARPTCSSRAATVSCGIDSFDDAAAEDADDRHPDHRRRLQQSARRAGARRRGTSSQNVRGFTVYGDYSQPDPQRDDRRRRRRRPRRHRRRLGTARRLLRAARADAARRHAGRAPSVTDRRSRSRSTSRWACGATTRRCATRSTTSSRGGGDDIRRILRVVRSAAAMTRQKLARRSSRLSCVAWRRPRADARRRSGGSTAAPPPIVTAVGPIPGPPAMPSVRPRDARNPYAQRSHRRGRRAPAVRPLQLLRLSRRPRRRRHGTEPARRRLALRQRDAQLFSSIAEGRAHGMPSWQTAADAGSDLETRHLHQVAADAERAASRRRLNRGHAYVAHARRRRSSPSSDGGR